MTIRCVFAQWAEQRLVEDEHFYRKIIFSDKAHFLLSGYVNKQNCRIWGSRESARRHGEADAFTTSDFGVVFGPAASLSQFSSKMSKKLPSLSMASATAPC